MELLSVSRQEAVRQIREQLCCVLCARIFEDPQCLDCKHNFCRECIFLHLRKNNSSCPTCRLPTRPSEITRNQFLESILVAWKAVETEIEHLGDPACHESLVTVADTDKALQRASAGSYLSPVASARSGGQGPTAGSATPSGAAGHEDVALPMSMQNRGRVANNKWNVDTQGIRQKMRAEEPYFFLSSPMGRTKSSSSDLPDDYGGRQYANTSTSAAASNRTGQRTRRAGKAKRKLAVAAATCSLEDAEEYGSDSSRYQDDNGSDSGVSSMEDVSQASSNALLHTQDINSYLERINRQREALSQWERTRRVAKLDSDAPSPMTSLLRSRTSSALPRFPRSSLEGSDEDETEARGDTQTQLPLSALPLDSPDLLSMTHMSAFDRLVSSARKSRRVDDESDEGEDDATVDADEWLQARLAKRRLELASSSPSDAPDSRPVEQAHRLKQIRVPSSQPCDGDSSPRSRIAATQLEMVSNGDAIIVPDSQAEFHEDEELETKPALPLPLEQATSAPVPATTQLYHASRASQTGKKPTKRISQDFEGAIKAFQAQQLHDPKPSSAAAAALETSNRETHAGGASASPSRMRNGILNAAMMRTVTATPPRIVTTESTILNRPPLPVRSSTNGTSAADKKRERDRSFVLVGTDLSKEEVKRVMDVCVRLGGRFGRHFDTKRNRKTGAELSSVTHLITKSVPSPFTAADGETLNLPGLRCKRTAKYMQALAEGAFVVDMKWVLDSLSAGKWLPEEPYEMEGDMYSDAMGKPRESRLRRAQTGRRNDIFNMFRFVMLCQDEEFEYQLQSVRSVVETFGGVVNWAHEYDALSAEQRARKTPIGVVSKSLPSWVAKTRWQQYQIPIVRVTWLFDSISHVEVLPFDDYYPY